MKLPSTRTNGNDPGNIMTTISPSLLSCDFLQLQKEIESLSSETDLWFHLDIMDGHFVPNLTFGPTVLKNIKKITTHKLDAHFMVTNPQEHIEWFKDCGIHNFTFHWESNDNHGHLEYYDNLISKIKKHYPSVGISLNPSSAIELIPDYILKKIDLILIMSVNPGFGGQKFIDYSFDKIRSLVKRREQLEASFQIQVDGGVTDANAKQLIDTGADNLVAGSYIFGKTKFNYTKQINSLRTF